MAAHFIGDTLKVLRHYQQLGTTTIERLSDDQLHWEPGDGANTVAVIAQHLAGNMRSRFTGFLTTDGEKPDRNRDAEFEQNAGLSSDALMHIWNAAWQCVYTALEPLTDDDLKRTVFIRGEAHTVQEAVQRQLAHYSYHVGQMVYLGKVLMGDQWESLSIPRGGSNAFNHQMTTGP